MVERKTNISTFSELRNIRGLFPEGNIGVSICRKALQIRMPEEIAKLREEFGEGRTGTNAFLIIAVGSVCEGRTEEKRCDKVASFTIDFDIFGEAEHIPVCGQEHGQFVRQAVARDLHKSIYDPTFATNGRGRS